MSTYKYIFIGWLTLVFFSLPNVISAQSPNAAEIHLGAVFSLTSFGARAGESELNAIKLAVSDINAKGGVVGRKIVLHVEDNRSDMRATVDAFSKLASVNKVPLIFGPNWAEFSEAAAPIAEPTQTILMTASGYTPELTLNRQFVFTLLQSHSQIIEPLANEVLEKKFAKMAMLVSANGYFESMANAFEKHLSVAGMQPFKRITINPGELDFRSVISQLKRDRVDSAGVFILGDGSLAAFLKQSRDLGLKLPLYGTNAVLFDSVLSQDMKLADGLVFFDYITRATNEFKERFRAEYKAEPIFSAPPAYDSVFLVKSAIEICANFGGQISSDCLAKTIRSSDYFGISGHIRFDEHGNINNPEAASKLFIVRGGQIEPR